MSREWRRLWEDLAPNYPLRPRITERTNGLCDSHHKARTSKRARPLHGRVNERGRVLKSCGTGGVPRHNGIAGSRKGISHSPKVRVKELSRERIKRRRRPFQEVIGACLGTIIVATRAFVKDSLVESQEKVSKVTCITVFGDAYQYVAHGI